jgi:hypothetical protein
MSLLKDILGCLSTYCYVVALLFFQYLLPYHWICVSSPFSCCLTAFLASLTLTVFPLVRCLVLSFVVSEPMNILCRCCAICDWLFHLLGGSDHLGHNFHSWRRAVVRTNLEWSSNVQRSRQAWHLWIHGIAPHSEQTCPDHFIASLVALYVGKASSHGLVLFAVM